MWLGVFTSFSVCLQWTKTYYYEKHHNAHPFIHGHERETIDISLHKLSPIELTNKAKNYCTKLELGTNIYGAAYKTLHRKTQKTMNYSLENVMQTQFTTAFTLIVQFTLAVIMFLDFAGLPNFDVVDAPSMQVLFARVFCSLIMHVQTEQYVRFGLNMQKYAINHHTEFSVPMMASLLGFSYSLVTMMISLSCIVTMCAQNTFLDTLKSYVSYTAICFLPNFVFLGLPPGHSLKAASPDLSFTIRRRFIKHRPIHLWICRCLYKLQRFTYGSCWYYFLPIVALILPFICINWMD